MSFPGAEASEIIDNSYNFISFNDNNFYSSYLINYSAGTPDNYFLLADSGKYLFVLSGNDFAVCSREGECYPLVNINLPFLTLKDNVIKFIHPGFAIKFLYVLHTLGNKPMVSDAMRTSEAQLLYKRRNWSDVESSPHMYGLAADMVYYSAADREKVTGISKILDIRFLEHGRGANRHIHLQDNEIWKFVKDDFNPRFCDNLNSAIVRDGMAVNRDVRSAGVRGASPEYKNFNFSNYEIGVLKIVFEDKFGRKAAEIRAGVFEPGFHSVDFAYDFLKTGVYSIRYYTNYDFLKSETIVVK